MDHKERLVKERGNCEIERDAAQEAVDKATKKLHHMHRVFLAISSELKNPLKVNLGTHSFNIIPPDPSAIPSMPRIKALEDDKIVGTVVYPEFEQIVDTIKSLKENTEKVEQLTKRIDELKEGKL